MMRQREHSPTRGRPLRADAARNRVRILDAAERVFAAGGREATTAEVAKVAGVGIGTVFRHFPTKEALLEALVVRRLTQLAAEADALAIGDDGDALFVYFARLVEQAAMKRIVVDALAAAGVNIERLMATGGARLRAAVARLLKRAQKAGVVRRDVAVDEVLAILMGIAHAAGQSGWNKRLQDRTLAVVFDGLRFS